MVVERRSKVGRVAAGVIVLAAFAGGGGACGSSHSDPSPGLTDGVDASAAASPSAVAHGEHLEIRTDSGRGLLTFDIVDMATVGDPSVAKQFTQTTRVDGVLHSLIEATADAEGAVVMRVAFGPLVPGLSHAELALKDGILSGKYDGRSIVPMKTTDDARSLTFQDGQPAPSSVVAEDVNAVLAELAAKARVAVPAAASPSATGAQAPAYVPKPPAGGPVEFDKSKPGTPGVPDDPQTSAACNVCKSACGVAFVGCVAGGFALCTAAFATIPFVGEVLVVVCDLVVFGGCTLGLSTCFTDVCKNSCCPINCGDSCCNSSDTCLNTDSGTCCGAGTAGCNADVCCPAGFQCMSNDQCCPPANTLCKTGENSPNCCNPGDQCLANGDCCPGNQETCDGNSVCCGAGLSCFLPNGGTTPECRACDSSSGGELCGSGDAAFCCDRATDVCLPVRTDPNGPPGCCNDQTSACVINDPVGNTDIVCCEPGTTCVRTEPGSLGGQSCCPSIQACTNPAICCTNDNPCIHPASGEEFCCHGEDGEEACAGNTECCNPGVRCLRTAEANTVCCTSAFTQCIDPLGNSGDNTECCDPANGESCVSFATGHHFCCAPKNVCGDACCPLGSVCEAEPTGPQCVPLSGAGGGGPCNPASGICPTP